MQNLMASSMTLGVELAERFLRCDGNSRAAVHPWDRLTYISFIVGEIDAGLFKMRGHRDSLWPLESVSGDLS